MVLPIVSISTGIPSSAAQRGRPARHRMRRAPWPPRRWWRHRLWRHRPCPTSPRPGWTWSWVHVNLGKEPEIDSSSIHHALIIHYESINHALRIHIPSFNHPYPMKIWVNLWYLKCANDGDDSRKTITIPLLVHHPRNGEVISLIS